MANIASNVIKEKLVNLKTTIPIAFKIVFSNPFYIAMAGVVSTIFWIVFNSFDQLLFFSPIISFYLPDDAIPGFILTNITSILMGILVAMNVHVIRNSKIKLDKSLLSGSILGIASSACASCFFTRLSCNIHIWRFWHNCNRFTYKLSDSITNNIYMYSSLGIIFGTE